MAKYEPPVTSPGPRGGGLLPPAPSGRPKPPPPPQAGGKLKPVTPTIAAPAAIEAKARKKKADEELTLSDVKSAAAETLPVMGQMALAAPAAMGGLLVGLTQPMDRKGKPWYEQAISYIPIVGSKTGQTLTTGIYNTLRGQNAKLAYESLKRGETPVPYFLEDVGNLAMVAAGAGATLKGVAAVSESAAVTSAAEAGAKQAFRVARVADTISDAPITLPTKIIGKGVNVSGRFGRWQANRLRAQAAAAEAINPTDPVVSDLRRNADKLDSYFGKEVFVDGIGRTLTNKALRKMNNRVLRAASTADDAVRQAMLGIQDRPLFRDDINPATGEAYGPLTPVENQAVIAILNGRARLINELMPRLNRTAAQIAELGRYRYAPGAGLTPEGAQLAVDFLNRNVDDITGQRLADAAERLSRELEGTTQLAREGYGRRRPLEPMYDIPVPEPVRLSARLRQEGAIDQADALDELVAQGFFDELLAGNFQTPAAQSALMQLQLVLEQAPDNVALDPAVYPPKERNNVAFYGRIREALKAQAAATAGGAPPGAGYPGGRPTPMDEGPTTGLQPEEFYDSINAPGAFSRMPERYLRNSIKQLERLRGRSRQIGEKIVQIEMSIRNLEFKIIKASLRIEALEGYYTDANGNRLLPGEDGAYPADATFNPGLIEKLKEKRAAAAAELARMRAEQAQTTVIDGKVHTVEQVEQIVTEADNAVTAVEAAIADLEAEIDDTTNQIDDMEGAQADAANALQNLGEDPTPIMEAAAADAESVPGDPEAFLNRDDGTAALESARADVEAARTALGAARNVELEARAKITDLEARYRNEQDAYQAELRKQEKQLTGEVDVSGLTEDNVRAVIDDADGAELEPEVAAALRDALDSEYVPPTQTQARSKLVTNIETAAEGSRVYVVTAFGKRYVTDAYTAIEITPTSPLQKMFLKDGQYDNPWGSFSVKTVNKNGNQYIEATINGVTYTIERVRVGENAKGKPKYNYRLGNKTYKTVSEAKRSLPLNRRSETTPNVGKIIVDATEFVGDAPAATPVGRGNSGPGMFSVIVFENADGAKAGFTEGILNGVLQQGDTLHFVDPNRPAVIRRNGETIGIIMPVRGGGDVPIGLQSVVARLPQEVAAKLPVGPKLSRPKQPKRPTITPDDLDAATAEWNNAQDAVRAADQALLAAQNQLRGVEAAAPAARLAPPGKFSKAEVSKRLRAVAKELDPRLTWQIGYRTADGTDLGTFSKLDPGSIQDAILPHGTVVDLYGYSRGRNAELITVERVDLGDATKPAAAIKEQKPQRVVDPVVAATRAVTEATETLAAMEEYALEAYQGLEAAKAEAGDVQAASENYDAIVADVQKAQARLDEAQRKLGELRQEAPTEPRLTPPAPEVEPAAPSAIIRQASGRSTRFAEQQVAANRRLRQATAARRDAKKAGADPDTLRAIEDEVVAARIAAEDVRKLRIANRDEAVASAIANTDQSIVRIAQSTDAIDPQDPLGRGYYEGALQIAIDERRSAVEAVRDAYDKVEEAVDDYAKVIAQGAAPSGARASQLKRSITMAEEMVDRALTKVREHNVVIGTNLGKLADFDGVSRADLAADLSTSLEARLAAPPPPEIISTSAATEADWQKQSDGTYTINTGSRRYAALKVDVTPPGAKGKRTTWSLKRYGSDGEVIEGSTQVFPNFKAARDYVQQQIDADGLDTGQRYIYRPGRELGPGPGTEVPVSLLAAEQRLQRAEAAVGSAEQRLQNLRTQIEKNTARIDKLRVDEAAQRAKLAPMTAAAVRTEARLAPEIYTQPEMVQFAGQPRGVPMVGQALTPSGVPVMSGEGLPAMLRPTQATRRVVDEQLRAVNEAEAQRGVPVEERTREVTLVEKAVNEALLRRRDALPPTLPVRVALAAPREIGEQFIGSQYVPVGREIQRSSGARQTIEQGLTGDVVLRSERRRSGMGDEIYDILELGRVIASERRQMELNEGFRMLMNSQFALTPEQILGPDAVRAIEAQAYDAAVNEWGAYAPGVPNRDVVFERSRREIMGRLLNDEMKRRGFETLPIEGYIGGRVELGDIDGTSKFLPVYAKEKIMQRVVPAPPPAVGVYLRGTARVTGAFKNLTLPLSVVWQLGDLIGVFWSAAVTGVNPITMADYMVQMLRENYGGPTATRMDILRNIFKDPENRRVGELGELLSASGLQDTGLRIQETRRFRGQAAGAEPQTVPQRLLGRVGPAGSQLRRGAELAGAAFPTFRKGAYRINEAINRVGRHAYFLAKFGDELRKYNEINGTNLTVEDVGAMGLHQRPGPLRTAWEDVVDTANEVMGDWLDLTPRERKYVLPHLTFWAWTKHIHKMFVKVAKENPAAIKWQLYLGALAYDPDSDPLELYSSYIPTPGGGLAGTNFLNPFGDIVEGPLGTAVIKKDPSKLFGGLSPLPRILYAAATGQNIARGREVTRQYGTGAVSQTGSPINVPLITRPGELLGFSLQQFPLGTKLLDLMPSGQLPGTSVQTGPFERYDTGQARFKPMTSKPVPKFGGRLLTAARLLTLPGVPSMSVEKMQDIERRAQQRLRAFETAKKTAEARSD